MKRITQNDEIIYDILQIIDRADKPVGAGSIRRKLSDSISVSQATVGIILRDLQDRNFVERQGYRGHTITPLGRKFLVEHQSRQKQAHLTGKILERLSMNDAKCLIDILEARRAIETEVARLAAKRATAMEIETLSRNLQKLIREPGNSPEAQELDREFHALLRQAARNPLLSAMFELYEEATFTADGRNLDPVMGHIRDELTRSLNEDHARVVQAIIDRDGAAAERVMGDHVDHIIDFITEETGTPG